MKIAVTGGSGFIGTYLVEGLIARGHDAIVVDSRPPVNEKAAWCKADILDLPAMTASLAGVDAVYHLAAISNVNQAFADPIACIDANIRGTVNMLEAARQNKVGRVLFASSVWVYQAVKDSHPDEATPFSVDGAPHMYTSSKIAGEMLCHNYRQLYGVPVTIMRYGIPYGPKMRTDLLLPIFIRKAINGEPLTVMGDGKQYRKFIYIEDLIAGNIAALAPEGANKTYNLEGSEKVSVLEIAQQICTLLGGKIEYLPPRPGDFGGVEVDGRRALLDLGWQPDVIFQDGLARTVSYFTPIFTQAKAASAHAPIRAAIR